MRNRTLGYFGCIETGGRYIGALMVIDANGIPLEFKYTEPIKPTRIQSILYGGSLERYIKVDVIRAKLFKALSSRPEVIFVDNADPSLVGTSEGISVVMLHRIRTQGLDKEGQSQKPRENELLIKDHENRDPLRIVCHPENAAVIDTMEELVKEVSYSIDLVEPLGRVLSALTSILKEGVK